MKIKNFLLIALAIIVVLWLLKVGFKVLVGMALIAVVVSIIAKLRK